MYTVYHTHTVGFIGCFCFTATETLIAPSARWKENSCAHKQQWKDAGRLFWIHSSKGNYKYCTFYLPVHLLFLLFFSLPGFISV